MFRRDKSLDMKSRCFQLSNGLNLPAVGLGTYRIKKPEDVSLSVSAAIRNGYRLIDTAAVYNNEALIAKTLEGIYPDRSVNVKVHMVKRRIVERLIALNSVFAERKHFYHFKISSKRPWNV